MCLWAYRKNLECHQILDLIYGVGVCPLLFQPIGELLVWLVVRRDAKDGRR